MQPASAHVVVAVVPFLRATIGPAKVKNEMACATCGTYAPSVWDLSRHWDEHPECLAVEPPASIPNSGWGKAGPGNIMFGAVRPWLLIDEDDIVLFARDGTERLRLSHDQVFDLIEGIARIAERGG